MSELHREQSRRGVREMKAGRVRGQERQVEARQWRKTEIDKQVEGERKGKRSAERKIQEIDGHGTGVSREREGEEI